MFSKTLLGGYSLSEVDAHHLATAEQITELEAQVSRLQAQVSHLQQRLQQQSLRELREQTLLAVVEQQSMDAILARLQSLPTAHQALLLSRLRPARSAAILLEMAAPQRLAIMQSLTTLQQHTEPDGLAIIESFLDFFGAPAQDHFMVGGIESLATILSHLGPDWPSVREELKGAGMFDTVSTLDRSILTLQDIHSWSDRELHGLLKEVDRDTFLVVLKSSPSEFTNRVLSKCMSRRAAEEFREDLEIFELPSEHVVRAEIAVFLRCAQEL